MRWKRGFLRLWFVASGLWVVLLGGFFIENWDSMYRADPDPFFDRLLVVVVVVFAIPLGILVAGMFVAWILKGFRRGT